MSTMMKITAFVLAAGLSVAANAADGGWAQVGAALCKTGTEWPGGIYKVTCRAPTSRSRSMA